MPKTSSSSAILVEVGAGELIDKITILIIKTERIADPAKLINIRREIEVLSPARQRLVDQYTGLEPLEAELKSVNEGLWVIEDDIRACEAVKDFGPGFIELARSVYIQNDKRAELKKKINILCEARIIEEKSYHGF
jgi:hypothetical protein